MNGQNTTELPDAIYKIVDGHDGKPVVLFKTYSQADSARQVLQAQKDGNAVKEDLADVKMGSLARHEDGSTYTYAIGDLVGFQATGLIVVMLVLGGLSISCYLLNLLLRKLRLIPDESKHAKVATPVAPVAVAPAPVVASPTIHPGLSDEKLVLILALVASQNLGRSVGVVKFRPMNTMDWTWAVQGRTLLHTNRLV